jgi:hypothetical protein
MRKYLAGKTIWDISPGPYTWHLEGSTSSALVSVKNIAIVMKNTAAEHILAISTLPALKIKTPVIELAYEKGMKKCF